MPLDESVGTIGSNAMTEVILYVRYLFVTTFHPSLVKFVFAFSYVTINFLFDVNQATSLMALFILVLLDFVSGISAARYNHEPIRSSKIKHTAIKLTAYFAVIAAAHITESGLSSYFKFLDETVTAFFLLTELISLLENVGRFGVDTPKGLLQKLLDYKNKI